MLLCLKIFPEFVGPFVNSFKKLLHIYRFEIRYVYMHISKNDWIVRGLVGGDCERKV